MRDSLRCLRDLQAVDSRILELTKAREAFPARVAQLTEEIESRGGDLSSVEEKVAETSRERRLKELTLAAERRLDLLNDEIQDALNELEDDLAAARERRHHEVLRVRRALDRIREEARRHARKST